MSPTTQLHVPTPVRQTRAHTACRAHLSSYYCGESVLATTQFAAPSREERDGWIAALEHSSLTVSRLFRDGEGGEGGASKAAQVAEVDHLETHVAQQAISGVQARPHGGATGSGGTGIGSRILARRSILSGPRARARI